MRLKLPHVAAALQPTLLCQQWEGKWMLDLVSQIIIWLKNRCIIDTTENEKWQNGRAVEDSCRSLNKTKIWFASCAIATTVNCRHHLHGRMNRPVCVCCHWRYPWLVAYVATPTPLEMQASLPFSVQCTTAQGMCATCGVQLRGNNHHPCPKLDVIRKHLKENTGFEGEIHSQDRVCMTCYKSHLALWKRTNPLAGTVI